MTRAEAIEIIKKEYLCVNRNCDIERSCGKCDLVMPDKEPILEAYKMAIKALEQEPKIGHWIELGCVGNDNYDFECSECHHTDTQSKTVKVNYCWNCGAKMIEPQESEVRNDT